MSSIPFILMTLVTGGLCSIIRAPLNVIDVVGTKVILQCESDITASPEQIDWYFEEEAANSTRATVVSGCVPANYYVVQSSTDGQCNLIINSLSGQYAGRYTCQNGNETTVAAQVGVIVSGPSCHTIAPSPVVEGDTVVESCSTEYKGYFGTSTTWVFGLASARSQPNEKFEDPDQIVTTASSVNVNLTRIAQKPAVLPVTYILGFNVNVPRPPMGNATNTPSYQYQWTSSALSVLYKPDETQMQITGCTSPLILGQEVTCFAPADPPANYTWINPNGTETNGATMTVDQIGSGVNYTCVAWNSIGSSRKYCAEFDNINSGSSYRFSIWLLINGYAAWYLSNTFG